MIDGIAFGGFNVIDVERVYKKTRIPLMIVIRKKPDLQKIEKTLLALGMENKFRLMQKAGSIFNINKIYVQLKGLDQKKARQLLNLTCTRSLLPEPIRLAHIIATGIVKGESKGNA